MGVKLSDGREVTFDFTKVTRADFRNAVNPRGSFEAEDLYLSKVTGMPLDEVGELSEPDFQLIFVEMMKQRRESISPNLVSAST